jgi:membrane protein
MASGFVSVVGNMAKHRLARLMGILFGVKPGAGKPPAWLLEDLTRLEHFAHFCRHVAENFVRNKCLVRASALSYSSLLALIPILAVGISVTSSLLKSDGEEQIYELINDCVEALVPPAKIQAHALVTNTNLPPVATLALVTNLETVNTITNALAEVLINPPVGTNAMAATDAPNEDDNMVLAQKEAARKIHEYVQKTQYSTLGLVGMLLLVWVAIAMLANIESTFNDIWGVSRGRTWFWRIVLYWATLTLGPLVLAAAASLVGGAHLGGARHLISQMPLVGDLIFKLLPLMLVWLAFALIYLVVPNTRVRWSAALVGAMVAGTLWYVNNLLGYLYVSHVVTNSMIYGSLGMVPVFMLGLYFSWAFLLFGAQVAFAFQNRLSYIQDQFAEQVNQRGREFIALRLMTCLGLRYQDGRPPATTTELAAELSVSPRLTSQIVQTLLVPRLITEVAGPEAAYCPSRPLEAINAHQVLQAVRSISQPEIFTQPEPVRDEIYGEFARIEEAERVAAAAISLRALVERAQARLAAPALSLPAVTTANPAAEAKPAAAIIDLPPEVEELLTPAPPVPEQPARRIVVPDEDRDFPL